MLTVRRGDLYHRVADSRWSNPLDGAYAATNGGRWTAPGSYPTVYLCGTVPVARGVVNHSFSGFPYGPEDLHAGAAPLLVDVMVTPAAYLDVTSPAGCKSTGLPQSYPLNADGTVVGWEVCQPIGRRAHDAGLTGVACLSARAVGEELAHFNRAQSLSIRSTHWFADWFWPRV